MLIWKGLGFLVVVIAFVGMFASQFIFDKLFGSGYYEAQAWPKMAGCVAGAVAIWFLGTYLNSRPGRVFIDKQTGQEVLYKKRHDLFFIPMQWWSIIWLIGGTCLAFFGK